MLTEDDVIDAVRDELLVRGWKLVRRATARQRGDDLVMRRGDLSMIVEAKGAGSSRPTSSRYGNTFDRGQVFDHVAKAVLKALRVVCAGDSKAGVAFPDNADHRREIVQVHQALVRAGIVVFWVDGDGRVRADGDDEWLR